MNVSPRSVPKPTPRSRALGAAVWTAAALLPALAAAAQDAPGAPALLLPGALAGAEFASPSGLFSGAPRWAAVDPSAAADREFPAFDLALSAAFPDGGGGAAGGASLSAAFPTPIAGAWAVVDAAAGRVGASPTGFSAAAGLSKKATDDLALGLGFGVVAADGRPATPSFSAGARLGLPGLTQGGSEFLLSAAGIGAYLDGSSRPAGLALPVATFACVFRLVDGKDFGLSASGLLAARGTEDLVAAAGLGLRFGEDLSAELGWRWSASDPAAFSPVPAFSLRYTGGFLGRAAAGTAASFEAGFRRAPSSSAAFASLGVSGGGRDDRGPQVSIGPLEPAYSPALVSEIQVPLAANDPSGIESWKMSVYADDGSAVFEASGGKTATAGGDPLSRLFSVSLPTKVPGSVAMPLPRKDGVYRLRASARDLRGNESRSDEVLLAVDGTPPLASARIEGLAAFSPNGDGSRDSIAVLQEGSSEKAWTGTFFQLPSRRPVRTFVWEDGAPMPFAWDGRDDAGAYVADGVYEYVLSSADPAGNGGKATVTGIVVDAEPAGLSVDVEPRTLAAEGDPRFTSLDIAVRASRGRGLLTWEVAVVAEGGRIFRSWRGSSARLAPLPTSIRFDGRSAEGDPIPDGRYRARVAVEYDNGDRIEAASRTFVADNAKPSGRVRASSALLRVDAGGRTVLYHDLSPGADWTGVVEDEGGRPVRTFALGAARETEVEWNGLDDAGQVAAEGNYVYYARGKNPVGVAGETNRVPVRIAPGSGAAALIADRPVFSIRAADGRVRLLPRSAGPARPQAYELGIVSASSGEPVRTFRGRAPLPAAIAWDGTNGIGSPVPDGDYFARLSISFEGGAEARADDVRLTLDSSPPTARVAAEASAFSPNGDGRLDELALRISAGKSANWRGGFESEDGVAVRTFAWKGFPPETLSWDGADDDGYAASDGNYRFVLSGTDAAGNAASVASSPFRLDARVPTAAVAADKIAFSPNGDGFADSVSVRVVPSLEEGVARWSAWMEDSSGASVRVLGGGEGEMPFSAGLAWDGKDDGGRRVRDGAYVPAARLEYAKGDVVLARGKSVLLDATPPEIALGLSPLPFSPDGDGVDDELGFAIRAADSSALAGWTISVLDPEGYQFTSFSGREVPASPFAWDGRDLEGNLVEAAQDYSYRLIVRDVLGNAAVAEGTIPVDVFVLRDGDRLKIRVSSITFAPSSASLSTADAAASRKNAEVLDRVAAVLAKFPGYRIRVEGHAVNLSGTEREERAELEPLSLARAQAVVAELAARGIAASRLEARGLGGREPVVAHGDAAARWRNRRVEFVLVR